MIPVASDVEGPTLTCPWEMCTGFRNTVQSTVGLQGGVVRDPR